MDSPDDFWRGVSLAVRGLVDAAQKASYSLGFGAGGFGIALLIFAHYGITSIGAMLVSISLFFIFARLGKSLDDYLERPALSKTPQHSELPSSSDSHKDLTSSIEEIKQGQQKLLRRKRKKTEEKIIAHVEKPEDRKSV